MRSAPHRWPLLPLHKALKALTACTCRACALKFPLEATEFRLVNAYNFDHLDTLIYAIFQACDTDMRGVLLVFHLDDWDASLLLHVGDY